jgi:hypothetical protein
VQGRRGRLERRRGSRGCQPAERCGGRGGERDAHVAERGGGLPLAVLPSSSAAASRGLPPAELAHGHLCCLPSPPLLPRACLCGPDLKKGWEGDLAAGASWSRRVVLDRPGHLGGQVLPAPPPPTSALRSVAPPLRASTSSSVRRGRNTTGDCRASPVPHRLLLLSHSDAFEERGDAILHLLSPG